MSIQPSSVDQRGLQFAQCRALGHEWTHEGMVTDVTDPGFTVPISAEAGSIGYRSVCKDCGTRRVKWVGRRGWLGPTRYYHPTDEAGNDLYKRSGDDALTTEEWRRTWVVSLIGEEPAANGGRRARKRAAS